MVKAEQKANPFGPHEPRSWAMQQWTWPAAPKVAHVVLSLDVGGLERLVVDLVREGLRLGQKPVVVCLERPGELAPQIEAMGIEVHCVYKRPGIRPTVIRRLIKLFRKIQPDVVHTHQVGALFYAGAAARCWAKWERGRDEARERPTFPHPRHPPEGEVDSKFKIQNPRSRGSHHAERNGYCCLAVIHTEHGKHYRARRRTRWLGKWAGRYADMFCCVSLDIADEVRQMRVVPESKIVVVPNGIDLAKFVRRQSSVVNGQFVIGTVGRLAEVKCQDLLIRAFAKSVNGSPHPAPPLNGDGISGNPSSSVSPSFSESLTPSLLLVGDGPEMEPLTRLAVKLRVADRVQFVGYQAEPERLLAQMAVFALTSRSEGMPVSILEAWAAGVPVVASAVGGVPELVIDGETGLLFTPGDEAALVACLERLVTDRALAEQLAHAGRERVEREFSLARMAETYQRLYREVYKRELAIEAQ